MIEKVLFQVLPQSHAYFTTPPQSISEPAYLVQLKKSYQSIVSVNFSCKFIPKTIPPDHQKDKEPIYFLLSSLLLLEAQSLLQETLPLCLDFLPNRRCKFCKKNSNHAANLKQPQQHKSMLSNASHRISTAIFPIRSSAGYKKQNVFCYDSGTPIRKANFGTRNHNAAMRV